QGSVGQGTLQDGVAGHRPCSPSAVALPQGPAFDAEPFQRVESPARRFPSQPKAFAHVAAYPSAEVFHFPPPVGQRKVVPPSPDVALPLVAQLLAGQALLRVPQLADFLFEFGDGFGADAHPAILEDAEAQQAALPAWSRTAFLAVDFEFEVLLDPDDHSFVDAFRAALAAGKDRDVVGITHEA